MAALYLELFMIFLKKLRQFYLIVCLFIVGVFFITQNLLPHISDEFSMSTMLSAGAGLLKKKP